MAVHLGFPVKSAKLTLAQVPMGKIGGQALWLTEPQEVLCCASPCVFLCQILAPGDEDSAYFRYLYVFQCLNCKLPKVIRQQLSRINSVLTDEEEVKGIEAGVDKVKEKVEDDDWNSEPSSEVILGLLDKTQEKKENVDLVDLGIDVFEEDGKVTDIINRLFTLDLKSDFEVSELYEAMEGGVESAGEEKISNSQDEDDDDIGEEDMENENKATRDVSFDTLRYFSNYHLKPPVIRYCKSGRPLWYSDKDRPDLLRSQCPCGSARIFECQILPQLISMLGDSQVDFGSIYVYTCPTSCSVSTEEQGFYHPSQ